MSSNDDVIYLSDVRLSFQHISEPQVQKQADGKERIAYGADLILPESHPGYQQFMTVYSTKAAEDWKQNAVQIMQMIHADRKSRCYGSGSEKVNKKTFQPYDGYAGMAFITTSSKNAPQLIQADGSPVDPANTMAYKALAMKMYGGCRVNAAIRPWLQKPNPQKQYGHGVRCDLIAIQFCRDDAPFGESRPDVTGMFGQVAGAPAAPGFSAAPVPTMPAPPSFGAPGMPSFLGGQ